MTNLITKSLAGLFIVGTVLAVSGCTTTSDASTIADATTPPAQGKTMSGAEMDQSDTTEMKAKCMAMHKEMKAKMHAKMASGEMGMMGEGMMTPEKKAAMQAKHEKHMKCMELMPEMKAEMKEKCMQKHGDGKMDHCKMMKSETPVEQGAKQ